MENEWMGLSEDRLAAAAQQGPHALVEAMRRLHVTIDQASAKNAIYLRRMFWLNITLAIMTFVLAIVAVSTVVQAISVVKGWLS
jgi:hypothetical protein